MGNEGMLLTEIFTPTHTLQKGGQKSHRNSFTQIYDSLLLLKNPKIFFKALSLMVLHVIYFSIRNNLNTTTTKSHLIRGSIKLEES